VSDHTHTHTHTLTHTLTQIDIYIHQTLKSDTKFISKWFCNVIMFRNYMSFMYHDCSHNGYDEQTIKLNG